VGVDLGGRRIIKKAEETAELYRLDPDVESAEPNYYRSATATPDDTHLHLQWALHNTGQTGGTQDTDLDGPEAWDVTTGSDSIVIAVIDTGADLDHQDLEGNIWRNTGEDWIGGTPGHNGVDDDGNGKTDDYYGWDFANGDNDPDDDSDGHGTHVAGIMAAEGNNGLGIAGINWTASIMPLKVLTADKRGLVSDEIAAIDYAIGNGARIINASLGGPNFSQSEYNAIQRAREAGVLFVAAAGNATTDNDTNPVYPASHDLDNIISVAATDHDDALSNTSNYGVNSVDVAAPGVSIYSTTVGNSYQYRSGTSMAAPHVSGLAALIWATHNSLTYSQVKGHISNGVEVKGNLYGVVLTGGRINAYNSLNLPLPPSDLAAAALSSTQVDLSWQHSSSDETGFRLERKDESGGSFSEIATISAGSSSYRDSSLGASATYYYRVCAFNSEGDSSYSGEASVSTLGGSSSGSASGGGGCFVGTLAF
jgi:subtilisin family serine protease